MAYALQKCSRELSFGLDYLTIFAIISSESIITKMLFINMQYNLFIGPFFEKKIAKLKNI